MDATAGSDSGGSVWGYLDDAVDNARGELLEDLDPERQKIVDALADVLIRSHEQLSARKSAKLSFREVKKAASHPWVSITLDLRFASDATVRVRGWRKRFDLLDPAEVTKMASPQVREYTAEATWTFLYGFDAPCIALCRATLEQILKEVLVTGGEYTGPRLRRERPDLGTLIESVRRLRRLGKTWTDSATGIAERGNTALHRHLFEKKIRPQQAAKSLTDLVGVVAALFG